MVYNNCFDEVYHCEYYKNESWNDSITLLENTNEPTLCRNDNQNRRALEKTASLKSKLSPCQDTLDAPSLEQLYWQLNK